MAGQAEFEPNKERSDEVRPKMLGPACERSESCGAILRSFGSTRSQYHDP